MMPTTAAGRREVTEEVLVDTAAYAEAFLKELPDRPPVTGTPVEEIRTALGGPLPEGPTDASAVIARLIDGAEPGIVATTGPRYFGFVIGGALPASIAADWLTSLWDQNTGLFVAAPAACVVEEVSGAWLKQLLNIPESASFSFVTGCQMAHFTCLAAARHHVLAQQGWDVEADGLAGAPRVTVIAGAERHSTVDRTLRYLGFGTRSVVEVAADGQGRMDLDATRAALEASEGPTIVITQAGNVNTGAFDPIGQIADAAHDRGAWVHVDGAFGQWAAASPAQSHLLDGAERADSWATDGHKWLNVPYDSGLAFCAHPEAHSAAMRMRASYLVHNEEADYREPMDWTPESSRRGRGFTVYAAIRSLGRSGIAEIVDRCCANARRFAEKLSDQGGIEVLNDVVLNQVLVSFGDDERTRKIVERVQADGTCWMGGTVWHGRALMRISVSNWATTTDDVDRSVAAILRCAEET